MRNLVWCLLAFVSIIWICVGSCKKESGCGYSETNVTAPQSEQHAVKDYLTSINVSSALKDSSGLYYEMIAAGDGTASPGLCSQVQVAYRGSLTTGVVFDESNSSAFTVGSVVEGMKTGLRLLKKGGHIKLYIPPSLAYGAQDIKDQTGKVVIPANSILIFDVTLNSFD